MRHERQHRTGSRPASFERPGPAPPPRVLPGVQENKMPAAPSRQRSFPGRVRFLQAAPLTVQVPVPAPGRHDSIFLSLRIVPNTKNLTTTLPLQHPHISASVGLPLNVATLNIPVFLKS